MKEGFRRFDRHGSGVVTKNGISFSCYKNLHHKHIADFGYITGLYTVAPYSV